MQENFLVAKEVIDMPLLMISLVSSAFKSVTVHVYQCGDYYILITLLNLVNTQAQLSLTLLRP